MKPKSSCLLLALEDDLFGPLGSFLYPLDIFNTFLSLEQARNTHKHGDENDDDDDDVNTRQQTMVLGKVQNLLQGHMMTHHPLEGLPIKLREVWDTEWKLVFYDQQHNVTNLLCLMEYLQLARDYFSSQPSPASDESVASNEETTTTTTMCEPLRGSYSWPIGCSSMPHYYPVDNGEQTMIFSQRRCETHKDDWDPRVFIWFNHGFVPLWLNLDNKKIDERATSTTKTTPNTKRNYNSNTNHVRGGKHGQNALKSSSLQLQQETKIPKQALISAVQNQRNWAINHVINWNLVSWLNDIYLAVPSCYARSYGRVPIFSGVASRGDIATVTQEARHSTEQDWGIYLLQSTHIRNRNQCDQQCLQDVMLKSQSQGTKCKEDYHFLASRSAMGVLLATLQIDPTAMDAIFDHPTAIPDHNDVVQDIISLVLAIHHRT